MDLESIIQSELSQKEKSKYHILTHICEIQKDGADGPISKAETEMQTQRMTCGPNRRRERWGELRDQIDIYILPYVKQMASGKLKWWAE